MFAYVIFLSRLFVLKCTDTICENTNDQQRKLSCFVTFEITQNLPLLGNRNMFF